MVEERIVEVREPAGTTHTHTTVYEDRPRSGGSGWLMAIVLLVALVVGGYFLMQMSDSRASRDSAIERAADNVGAAAKDIGDAAKDATDGK
ncbi:hypothetical protein [Novosphingobium taihuense]|uniref:CHASE3 domain sensor protein n=1 Tax=Novosphingobium taihuense TaxID=260085 RepID=A0A7W7AEK4_9SPHN|nr:hypothetical protein [Novosphingobium taihuense]MBB4615577.1 CHASE3 domain sensor protein [Novosphingobium taihuense]TWH82868.1 hypothetical protein IQ25_03149 [Novosphingobium taihuense]